LVHLTSTCHLWTLTTSLERCTCTNICHLSLCHRLSVNVAQVKGTTNVCLLIK
jgi:hypothetical protein